MTDQLIGGHGGGWIERIGHWPRPVERAALIFNRLVPTALGLHHGAIVMSCLAADLAFIVTDGLLNVLFDWGFVQNELLVTALSVDTDFGVPEIYGYGKVLAIIVLLLVCGVRSRRPTFPAIASLFVLLLMDDALMIHERVGRYISGAGATEAVLGTLAHNDLGELAVFALYAAVLGAVLFAAWWRTDLRTRRFIQGFICVFLVLGFFAGALDMAHQVVIGSSRFIGKIFALAEDGGEMVGLSMALMVALSAYRFAFATTPPDGASGKRA